MRTGPCRAALAALATALAIPAAATAQAPPPPTATNGAAVTTLAPAGSVATPTEFAFFRRAAFVGAYGDPEDPTVKGGVFRIRNGKAKRLRNSPRRAVSGIAWRKGTRKLYVAVNKRIVVMSRWNGHRFLRTRTIYRGPTGFNGFTGLAFGPDNRLYSGVSLNDQTDQKPDTGPFARSVVSLKPNGTDIKVVATGLRQPWQLTFVSGNPNPFVSVLADERTPTPPDWIVNAKPGQNYGYPTCTQLVKKDCAGFDKPIALLENHSSPMGISPIGQTLYVALFGGLNVQDKPTVVSMNTHGHQITPFLTGYVAPVLAVGTRKGSVYTGDLTGAIYRVKAG
jgi:glucose/arabinose dehydrogenase